MIDGVTVNDIVEFHRRNFTYLFYEVAARRQWEVNLKTLKENFTKVVLNKMMLALFWSKHQQTIIKFLNVVSDKTNQFIADNLNSSDGMVAEVTHNSKPHFFTALNSNTFYST